MTLIITTVTKSAVVSSADSRFSYEDGTSDDENGSKNFKITTSDADILVSFCGIAKITNDPDFEITDEPYTMLWLGDFISRQDAHLKTAVEVIEATRVKLESLFQNTPVERMSPLILLFSCRPKSNKIPSYIKSISNIDTELPEYYNRYHASIKFHASSIKVSRKGVGIHIDGYMPATKSKEFQAKLLDLKEYANRRNSLGFDAIIRDKQIELIKIAAADAASNQTINNRIVATFLDPKGLMHVKHDPDDGLRRLPGFQNENMTVAGLSASGNVPGEDADYLVGPQEPNPNFPSLE